MACPCPILRTIANDQTNIIYLLSLAREFYSIEYYLITQILVKTRTLFEQQINTFKYRSATFNLAVDSSP